MRVSRMQEFKPDFSKATSEDLKLNYVAYNSLITGVEEGARNDSLFKLACSFRAKEVNKDDALNLMLEANKRNSPPLPDVEIVGLVDSAYSYSDEKELSIWNITTNGKKTINHKNLALVILKKHHFITVGGQKKEIYYYVDGVYKTGGDGIILQEVQRLTEGYIKNHDVQEVIGHIHRLTLRDRDILTNKDLDWICVSNGILNVKTRELLPHTPQKIFTQKIPHEYNPLASCPKFLLFLSQIISEKDIAGLQEYCGFSLYRSYFFKKALIFVGERDTGKTTLIKIIVAFFGQQNTSGESLHRITTDKFSAVNLHNKLLNFFDDLSFEDIKDVGNFKVVTGGGYISAEQKFCERFQFKNHAKLMFATNKISDIKDSDDDAYYSRWLITNFNNTFDGSNPNTDRFLAEKICSEEEMSGILNWALEGLERLLKNQKFTNECSPAEVKSIMMKSGSSISVFASECLEQGDGLWISKDDLYYLYSLFCSQGNLSRTTKEKFGREIHQKCGYILESRKKAGGKSSATGWLNVGLNKGNKAFLKLLLNKNYTYNLPNNINESTFFIIYKLDKSIISIISEDADE